MSGLTEPPYKILGGLFPNSFLIDETDWIKSLVLGISPAGLIPKTKDLIQSVSSIKKEFGNKPPKILYGGSVNPDNIAQLKDINIIDGFLVGRASQNSKKFIDIIKKTFN